MAGMRVSEMGEILVASADLRSLMVSFAVLLGVIGLGCGGICLVRRWMKNASQPVAIEPFTLEDLRNLHQKGELTDEEYERAKEKLVARVKRLVDAEEPSRPEPQGREKPPSDEGRSSS